MNPLTDDDITWTVPYRDRETHSYEVCSGVEVGNIVVCFSFDEFRWATYRIREVLYGSGIILHCDNGYVCPNQESPRMGNFARVDDTLHWENDDGAVRRIEKSSIVGVYQDEKAARPMTERLMALERSYIEQTRAVREATAVEAKLLFW